MTVQELIEILQTYPKDVKVKFWDEDWICGECSRYLEDLEEYNVQYHPNENIVIIS